MSFALVFHSGIITCMEEKELTTLQLGDEVWIPEKRPLFEKRNLFSGIDKNILIEELYTWPDGDVAVTSLLDGHGPDYWIPIRYKFAGCWKSDQSWKRFWTFTPLSGTSWEIKFCVNEVWNDLTGKNNSRPADVFHLLDSHKQIKREHVFSSLDQCKNWCNAENKKLNLAELAKGLRRLTKRVNSFKKELESDGQG